MGSLVMAKLAGFKMRESNFQISTYKINGQEYSVPDLSKWAAKNLQLTQLPLSDLMNKYIWGNKLFIDVPEEYEWYQRSMEADLKYPILVLRYPNLALEIIDGNHRAWKAWKTKESFLPAYLLDSTSILTPEEIATSSHI